MQTKMRVVDTGGGGVLYPYQSEVAKALSRTVKIAGGTTQNGWHKVGHIPISALTQSYANQSIIFLVNGLYASQGSSGGAESGIFEVDTRKSGEATFQSCGVNILAGSLLETDIGVVNEGDAVTLYYRLPTPYNSCAITVLSEEGASENDPTEVFQFDNTFYGANPPDGIIYAVVRNRSSESESANRLSNSIVLGRQETNVGWHKFAEIKAADIGNTVQAGYSAIVLVNGVVPDTWQEDAYGYGAGSAIVEIDGRANTNGMYVNDSRLKINVLCGFLDPNNICGVTSEDLTTISLYINTIARYGQYSFSIFSENCENSTDVKALTFVDEFYGTTAPANAVYGVVRNQASSLGGKEADEFVDTTSNQSVGGQKTFTAGPFIAPPTENVTALRVKNIPEGSYKDVFFEAAEDEQRILTIRCENRLNENDPFVRILLGANGPNHEAPSGVSVCRSATRVWAEAPKPQASADNNEVATTSWVVDKGYLTAVPTASQTVVGGAKMYKDSEGYFCIDTE